MTKLDCTQEISCLHARHRALVQGAVVLGSLGALHQEGDNLHLLLVVEGHLHRQNRQTDECYRSRSTQFHF